MSAFSIEVPLDASEIAISADAKFAVVGQKPTDSIDELALLSAREVDLCGECN
jgi:hypothetical protein